jgi:hypothetical protein
MQSQIPTLKNFHLVGRDWCTTEIEINKANQYTSSKDLIFMSLVKQQWHWNMNWSLFEFFAHVPEYHVQCDSGIKSRKSRINDTYVCAKRLSKVRLMEKELMLSQFPSPTKKNMAMLTNHATTKCYNKLHQSTTNTVLRPTSEASTHLRCHQSATVDGSSGCGGFWKIKPE